MDDLQDTATNSFAVLRSLKKKTTKNASASSSPIETQLIHKALLENEGMVEEQVDYQDMVSSPLQSGIKRKKTIDYNLNSEAYILSKFIPNQQNVALSKELGLCAVRLNPGESLCFQGTALVAPLLGSMEVFGYELKADSIVSGYFFDSSTELKSLELLPCFSPKSHSLLAFHCNVQSEAASPIPPKSAKNKAKHVKNKNKPTMKSSNTIKTTDSLVPLSSPIVLQQEGILGKIKDLLSGLQLVPGCSVLLIKSCEWMNICSIEMCAPLYKELFTTQTSNPYAPDFHLPGFQPMIGPAPSSLSTMTIPSSWKAEVAQMIHQFSAIPNEFKTVAVVGGRNVGKSTFCRYVTNALVNSFEQVAFLDSDAGQTEFNPTGVVSLQIVQHALLGPPFTHQKLYKTSADDISKSIFIGSTSPRQDPDAYIAALIHLVQHFRSHPFAHKIPLIVNTQGWIKGMGFDLVLHFLESITPNRIVCLEPPTQEGVLESGYAGIHISSEVAASLQSRVKTVDELTATVVSLHSVEDRLVRSKFNPADIRNLSLFTYFSQSVCDPTAPIVLCDGTKNQDKPSAWWRIDEPLTRRLPVSISWNQHLTISPQECLYALNGTLVALIHRSVNENDSDEKAKFALAAPPLEDSEYIGYGIIRSISVQGSSDTASSDDPDTTLEEDGADRVVFHILTPLPLDKLQSVNVILRGWGMELPVALFISGYENSLVDLPYTTFAAAEGSGALARRNRHNLQRRKNM